MRRRRLAILATVALLGLVAVAAHATASPPQQAEWDPLTLEGDPVDAGFLSDGLVYATTGATPAGTAETACTTDTGDADLFLVSFPEGPGCLEARNAPGTADGVEALATASRGSQALAALPGTGSQLSGPNLVLYERSGDNLTEVWTDTIDGRVLDVALDPEGDRGAVAVRADGDHRLLVVSASGEHQDSFPIPGEPRAIEFSPNGRYLAAGGNYTDGDRSLGWANLYDLQSDDNPVLERTIPRPRAGIVTSAALTDEGRLTVGLFDGTARWIRPSGNDREVSVGTDPAHLDVDEGLLFAAAGNETAGLDVTDGQLSVDWRTRVNGTSEDAIARAPHLFAVAETVNALGPEGDRLWEMRGGPVVAFNATGLGAAVATEADDGGLGAGETSVLEGRVLHRQLQLDQPDRITVSPGGIARENVTFANEGAAILNLTPTASPAGLRVTTDPSTVEVLPGEERSLLVTVRASNDASPGERSVDLDLQARPSVNATPAIDVNVTSAPNVTIELAGGEVADRTVTQGQTVTLRLDLRNQGNAEAQVDLGLMQSVDQDWPSRIQPDASLTVPPGAATTARVEVDVPAGAANGTDNRIIVRGESDQGVSALQLNLTVNPFEVIRIRPDTITQSMAPGETRAYDLTVENLGSVEAQTELDVQALDADGSPCVPTAWGLTLGASQVSVPAQGSRPVRVEVTAPAEIPVPEVENGTAGCTSDAQRPSLRVELHGRSGGGSEDSSILYANAEPSQAEEPDTNDQPTPGIAWIAGVLSLTAIAVRGAKP